MAVLRKGHLTCSTVPFPSNHGVIKSAEVKAWPGNDANDVDGRGIWSDGSHIYHSDSNGTHVLVGNTWELKEWDNFSAPLYGNCVWTDGVNIYFSRSTDQYVFDGTTWVPKTWENAPENLNGQYIWSDGNKIYYSYQTYDSEYNPVYIERVLNGNRWEEITWEGYDKVRADYIWSDGTHVYLSYNAIHYVLNGNKWEAKEWNLPSLFPDNIWSDGTHVYYRVTSSDMNERYILEGDIWKREPWTHEYFIYPPDVWSDGEYVYCTSSPTGSYPDGQHCVFIGSNPTPVLSPSAMMLGYQLGRL